MSRKPKLTERQWEEVGRRLLNGEKGRALAREFSVSEAAIRKRFGAQHKEIKSVANQMVVAETAFNALPVSAQVSARTLADRLKAISNNLADAAHYGAATAHRLSAIANNQVEKVDDAEPEKSLDVLSRVAVLTKMANSSSEIGLNLLRANRETIDDLNKEESRRNHKADESAIGSDPQEASKTYLEIMGE